MEGKKANQCKGKMRKKVKEKKDDTIGGEKDMTAKKMKQWRKTMIKKNVRMKTVMPKKRVYDRKNHIRNKK